ncbi:endospore germination permease [Priestia megaterium]|uniref:GerAB/ArcD/ProY family transporter n=1 Tax=Priestia megaterium TaxID=1404 RepID=UPI0024479826|nr:endospore germination permease [Priestia megaterium]MDH2452796.1 endospore germination permease [Priestia megaterium]MDL5152253.1 endospore germination permease [Priestia megaterium]
MLILLNEINISAAQFRKLVTLYSIGSTIIVVPAAITADAHQDAWIAALFGVALGIGLVLLFTSLGKMFPTLTLMEMNEKIFGKLFGKIVSAVFVLSNLFISSQVLYYVGNFLTTQILPYTPLTAIHIAFMGVVIVGVRLGIEVIARSAEILFPWFVGLFGLLIVSMIPQIKIEHLQPVFEIHPKAFIRAVLTFLSISSLTYTILLMIFPSHTPDTKKATQSFYIGNVAGGLVMVTLILLGILVLGPYYSQITMFPSYELGRRIDVGNFLQGIEVIIAIIWFLTLFFKVSLYFHASIAGLCHIFNVNETRFLTLPMGLIVTTFSIIVYPTIIYQKTWLAETWIPYSFFVGAFYPFILLIIGWIRFRPAKIKKIIKST